MLNKLNCPDIEDKGYEAVLEWAKAKVSWNDKVYDSDGTEYHSPETACWGFSWEYGGISLDIADPKEEQAARRAAAMSIFLWCKGINMSLAWKLGVASTTSIYFEI